MTGFLGAVQFLTRVPVRLRTPPSIARSVPWFPIVGALIGAACGVVAAWLWDVVPVSVGATLAVFTGILLTGAFHEDGLADVADAMGGATSEQRREILKDPRHGTYGVVALVGSVVLRVGAVFALPPAAAFASLVSAHALARAGAVVTMVVAPTPPAAGLGSDFARDVRTGPALVGVAAGIAIAALLTGWWVAPLVASVCVTTFLVAWVAHRALGGVTGDVLGAIEQVGECVVLAVAARMAAEYGLWWS